MRRLFPLAALVLAAAGPVGAEDIVTPAEVPAPKVVTVDPAVRPDFDLSHSLPPAGIDPPKDPWGQAPTIVNNDRYDKMRKSDPAPEPVKFPEKMQRMYRNPHPHPAVVASMAPSRPRLSGTGSDVYVNTPGSRYYNVKSRQVFRHSVIIPKKRAEEYGYKPDNYTNPEGNTQHTNEPQADK